MSFAQSGCGSRSASHDFGSQVLPPDCFTRAYGYPIYANLRTRSGVPVTRRAGLDVNLSADPRRFTQIWALPGSLQQMTIWRRPLHARVGLGTARQPSPALTSARQACAASSARGFAMGDGLMTARSLTYSTTAAPSAARNRESASVARAMVLSRSPQPNVRAQRAPTSGRQARAGEIAPRSAEQGRVACRWRSA